MTEPARQSEAQKKSLEQAAEAARGLEMALLTAANAHSGPGQENADARRLLYGLMAQAHEVGRQLTEDHKAILMGHTGSLRGTTQGRLP